MADTKPETFGDISDEMQWEWNNELDVLWEFINDKDLYDEAVAFARKAADAEKLERREGCDHDDTFEDGHDNDGSQIWQCRRCGYRFNDGDIREGRA